ncbi:MAG: hypothetical protein JW841_17915 [Deltaproteobacteria bacterium]|nr:hypothetical protein [Deltaproteobacteria bacterium]
MSKKPEKILGALRQAYTDMEEERDAILASLWQRQEMPTDAELKELGLQNHPSFSKDELLKSLRPIDETTLAKLTESALAVLPNKNLNTPLLNDCIPNQDNASGLITKFFKLIQSAFKQPRFAFAIGSFAVAAACSILLLVMLLNSNSLPLYSLEISKGDQIMRGVSAHTDSAESAVPKVSPGSLLQVFVRPENAVNESVAAYSYLLSRSKPTLRAWPAEVLANSKGTIRLQYKVSQDTAPGEYELIVAVTSDPKNLRISEIEHLISTTADNRDAQQNLRILRAPIEIVTK